MTSSWDSYYVVFLSAILSLGIPAVLAAISLILFPRNPSINKSRRIEQSKEFEAHKANRTILGQRINVRFFLAANAALILITLALALIPCATTLKSENLDGLLKGLVSIITIAGFAVLGLLYSVRKGDMGWLSSFQPDSSKKEERND
jgi:NADH:ubiquinone oxidoreductase subunit 3 (subunit A)